MIWLLSGYKMDVKISWSQKSGLGLDQQFTAPLLTQPWLASNWYFSIYVFQSALSSKSASSVYFFSLFTISLRNLQNISVSLKTCNKPAYSLQKLIFVWVLVFFGIWRCCERIGRRHWQAETGNLNEFIYCQRWRRNLGNSTAFQQKLATKTDSREIDSERQLLLSFIYLTSESGRRTTWFAQHWSGLQIVEEEETVSLS